MYPYPMKLLLMNLDKVIPEAASQSYPEKGCVVTAGADNNRHFFNVGHQGGMIFFTPIYGVILTIIYS